MLDNLMQFCVCQGRTHSHIYVVNENGIVYPPFQERLSV